MSGRNGATSSARTRMCTDLGILLKSLRLDNFCLSDAGTGTLRVSVCLFSVFLWFCVGGGSGHTPGWARRRSPCVPSCVSCGSSAVLVLSLDVFVWGLCRSNPEALLPFMCYSHPNGKSSVLELSDVICWESEQHITMVIFGVCMTAVMCCYWCFLLFLTRLAPIKSQEASDSFFKSSRFLFFRFRPDFWWYGTWFILRGPLLAIPMTIFTDFPHVQLFVMTAVLDAWHWELSGNKLLRTAVENRGEH